MIDFPEISAEETLRRARQVNELKGFEPIPDATFDKLLATAPPWPDKPGCIRSLKLHPERTARSTCDYEEFASIMAAKQILGEKFGTRPIETETIYRRNQATGVEWVCLDILVDHHHPEWGEPRVPDYGKSRNVVHAWMTDTQYPCAEGLLAGLWLLPEVFERILERFGHVTWEFRWVEMDLDCTWGPVGGNLVINGRSLGRGPIEPPLVGTPKFSESIYPAHGFWIDSTSCWRSPERTFRVRHFPTRMPPAP